NPKEQEDGRRLYSILLVTDDEGNIGSITKQEIVKAKNRLKTLLGGRKLKPLFYFLDPLVNVSLTTRQVLADLWTEMPFSFFPIQKKDGHELCIRPFLNMNEPELLTGVDETKIHFQIGPAPPLDHMLQKDKGSVLKKIYMKDALLIMFRNQNVVNFHLHMPLLNKRQRSVTEATRVFYAKWLFTELRQLRIPSHIELTVDGLNAMTGIPVDDSYYKEQIYEVLKDMLLFPESSVRSFWPQRLSEEPSENISYLFSKCRCSLCTRTNFSAEPRVVRIYKGNVNDLITKAVMNKAQSIFSTNSRVSASIRAFIETMSDEFKDIDLDIPLDPLELKTEEEMQTFLSTLPGQEQDKEIEQLDVSKLPPIQKSDPALFGNHPMDGIPDQFRPGDWRNTDIMDRIPSEVPDHIKKQFGDLLDKYSNLFSYFPDNCRPLSLKGKPVILDIELVSDIPIFMKPYTCFGSQIDMLDNKITDLLEKNEIHRIKSDYNIAVILTHHNSSQKHVQGADKKVRMCLDLRIINMLTKNKNIDSHLVTGIEQKKTVLKGNRVLTSADISKAYRAIMASERLQQITAFRCPSSRKYPNDTFAFKSAADGLACMPGLYSRVLQEALSPEARRNCISHIDDILIYSKTYEDHLHHLEVVFKDLMKCNFLLSASKLKPFQKEVYFLGFMVSGDEQWIPEDRLAFVDKIEVPKNKKQIQSLLGTANYLSAFIDGFQQCCGPLYDAMKGKSDKTPLQLNDVQMKAFYELKRLIKNAPRLSHLDTSQPIYMECDASLTGAGSILYHIYNNPDGSQTKKVVRYGSRRWSLTESLNHTSLEREALAILVGAKTHMLFLQACPEVIIKTDLKSLVPILSCYNNPDSNTMAITSHRIYALPFKWKLHHTPGVSLPVADLFSRIHKPYECQYTDRKFRYPDLKREQITMPDEWKNNPDLVLTTTDLMEAMRQQILFIEKSSYNVKEKRLKALLDEVVLIFDGLGSDRDILLNTVKDDLKQVQDRVKKSKTEKAVINEANVKLTNPPQKTLITPEFLIKGQNSNPKLY
ncbi:MAG TPA: reverse transcriptase domain-containing protein, partial [Thermodesulfobacteriota bacterium]